MKLLTFSSLYPNSEMPSHGVFVENRLRHLVAGGRVEARVVAPVQYFPSTLPRFGHYAKLAAVPRREVRHGIEVLHPRYVSAPGLGRFTAPFSMAIAAFRAAQQVRREGFDFDAIDAHYFYPDGVAGALLARWCDRPLVVTARGSDINELARARFQRRLIVWAARQAWGIVTVCEALKVSVAALGIDVEKIQTLRNGVDLGAFQPSSPREARARLGLPPDVKLVASVGRLVPLKGHDLVIEAIASDPGLSLVIAGAGPEEHSLRALAQRLGVADRVHFLGQVRQAELPSVYNAADVLVLASSSEGWANVLLEAMACGTPVVATDVGGSREVVDAPEAGILVERRDAPSIGRALRRLVDALPDRAATRRYAERFSWDDTTRGQERLFASVTRRAEGGRSLGVAS